MELDSQSTKVSLSNVIKGTAAKSFYNRFLIGVLVFITVMIGISIALYEGYRLDANEISHLDRPGLNPIGFWFFKIGMIGGGICFLPIAYSFLLRMKTISKVGGVIAGVFYILSGIGMILIGFFPSYISQFMHVLAAGMGFGSLLLAILISTVLVLVKYNQSKERSILLYGAIFYIPVIAAFLLTIIFAGIPLLISLAEGIPYGEFIPEGWYSLEWSMLITGLFSTLGTQQIF